MLNRSRFSMARLCRTNPIHSSGARWTAIVETRYSERPTGSSHTPSAESAHVKFAAASLAIVALVTLIGAGWWLWTPDKSEAALEAKYLNAPGDRLDVAGLRLHVRDSGPKDAPAVVLLHGFGSSLHTWEPWAQTLSSAYRVIRFDLPGFALTGADPTGDYTVARSMQVLTALLDRLAVKSASVVGHSMGGKIAWNFAARHPERVDKLVLVSPDGFATPGNPYGRQPEVSALAKLMRFVLPKTLLRSSLAPAYGDPSILTDAVVTRYHDLLLAPGVRAAIIARMGQSVIEDPAPALQSIQAPTLLIWGEKDAMIPLANAADYIRIIPGATLVSLLGLGHVPHEEAPAVSLEPVRAFLAR